MTSRCHAIEEASDAAKIGGSTHHDRVVVAGAWKQLEGLGLGSALEEPPAEREVYDLVAIAVEEEQGSADAIDLARRVEASPGEPGAEGTEYAAACVLEG
jgi:hypothetical protein